MYVCMYMYKGIYMYKGLYNIICAYIYNFFKSLLIRIGQGKGLSAVILGYQLGVDLLL